MAVAACAAPSTASLAAAQLLPLGDTIPGRILFVKDSNIWMWSEGRARQLTTGNTWQQPRWSPDGSRIAYVYRTENFSEIFVMDADGSNAQRLTRSQSSSLSNNDWTFWPTWSPDGSQLAFVSDSNSYHPTLWLMNADGSSKRQPRAPPTFQEADDALAWSPDGRRLAVTHFEQQHSQIYLFELPRGPLRPLTESPLGALDPAWSPDGSTLAYAVREAGRVELRLRHVDEGPEVTLKSDGYSRAPAWSPDGRRLAFLSSQGGGLELYTVELAPEGNSFMARNERQLTQDLNLDGTSGVSWGP